MKGPGVIGIESYGETSGRFEVAEVSARVFPAVMADFIAHVKAEGFPLPDFSKIHRFSEDQYTYLAPKLVQRLPRGVGVANLRDAPAAWSLQYAKLGLAFPQ